MRPSTHVLSSVDWFARAWREHNRSQRVSSRCTLGGVDCSSTLSLTSALGGGAGQHHAPAALAQGMTWYPLCRRLGWAPGPAWTGISQVQSLLNLLTPNDHYRGRTAPLTSKRCILYIYSTNIGTEYSKHGVYSPFFPLQNAVCFIILTYLVPVLFTFYIRGVLKL